MMTVEWRGKPVWILRRTPEMLASLKKTDAEVADPNSDVPFTMPTPEYCKNETRSRADHKDLLVVVGICSHLGCSPSGPFPPAPTSSALIPASCARATARPSTWPAACSRTSRRRRTLTSPVPVPVRHQARDRQGRERRSVIMAAEKEVKTTGLLGWIDARFPPPNSGKTTSPSTTRRRTSTSGTSSARWRCWCW
jgi:Rieske Fe-S protein